MLFSYSVIFNLAINQRVWLVGRDAFIAWVWLQGSGLGWLLNFPWRRCHPAKRWERSGEALKSLLLPRRKPRGRWAAHAWQWGWAAPLKCWCSWEPFVLIDPHTAGEKNRKPAQEGLVVRRKYYLTCIVLGKENKGPGTEPGPLASFFFSLFYSSGQLF